MTVEEPVEEPVGTALSGRRIGILEARHPQVLADLVQRNGGIPVSAPCLRELPLRDGPELVQALETVAREPVDIVIFQTGVGANALHEAAAELGLSEALAARLAAAVVVARGPKPLAALLKRGVRVDRRTAEPHTTIELVSLLEEDLSGKTVLVQHYGSRNADLVDVLRIRGARLLEAEVDAWGLPQDLEPIRSLLRELREGSLHAVLFTTRAQVLNLIAVAEAEGCADRLRGWLAATVTASIGPTTSATLREHGFAVDVEPQRPKLVPLVRALSAYWSTTRPAPSGLRHKVARELRLAAEAMARMNSDQGLWQSLGGG